MSGNPRSANHEFSKKNLLALGAKFAPVVKTRGVWSEPMLDSATRDNKGKEASHSGEINTLSSTLRT
jgi:hypothetical protein